MRDSSLSFCFFLSFLCLSVFSFESEQSNGIGLTVGGFGGGVTVEIVLQNSSCLGVHANPPISNVPSGTLFSWFSEYVDNKLYVCGGSDLTVTSICYTYDPSSMLWDTSCSLVEGRMESAALVFNNTMYVFGGYNNKDGWLDSSEQKTPGECSWSPSWKLKVPTKESCALSVNSTHILFLGGTIHNFFHPQLNTTDFIDMRTGNWVSGEDMDTPKALHACIEYIHEGERGALVSGGCTSQCHSHLNDVRFFSFKTNIWKPFPSLNEKRSGHGMTLINGVPTVIGGYNTHILNSVETFENGQWILKKDFLKFGRWAFGSPKVMPPLFDCQPSQ